MNKVVSICLLIILSFFSASPAEAKGKKGQAKSSHRVVQGESLYGIARKAGMSVDALKRLNGLKGNLIKPGMVLQLRPKKNPAPATAQKKKSSPAPPVAEAAACPPEPVAVKGPLPYPAGDLEEVAMAYLTTPYRFGAENRQSTDCSGFTQQVFRQLGLDLPRTAREQFRLGEAVPQGEWQRGDLLFFRTYARYPSHVGIYLDNGKMIHASRSKRQVIVSDIDLPYFRKRYLGARRVATFDPVANLIEGLLKEVEEVNEEGVLEGDLEAPGLTEPPTGGPVAAAPDGPELSALTPSGG